MTGRTGGGTAVWRSDATSPARRSTPPACRVRPPWPPKRPSVNVARLPRYSGTSNPPRTSRYARAPAPAIAPIVRRDPTGTSTGSQNGTRSPFPAGGCSVASMTAPVRQIVASRRNRSVGPLTVISRPAADSALPRARLPRRKERSSIGPLGGTPTAQ